MYLRDGNVHDRRLTPHEVVKVETTLYGVKLTLNNGVQCDISSNPNELHASFSFADHVEAKEIHASNNITIAYQPYKTP
jgi:hypothetical protein